MVIDDGMHVVEPDVGFLVANHARKIAYHLPEFRRLIIQAKDDGLHKVLGFKSWKTTSPTWSART
jgi:hypothetical protein